MGAKNCHISERVKTTKETGIAHDGAFMDPELATLEVSLCMVVFHHAWSKSHDPYMQQ